MRYRISVIDQSVFEVEEAINRDLRDWDAEGWDFAGIERDVDIQRGVIWVWILYQREDEE